MRKKKADLVAELEEMRRLLAERDEYIRERENENNEENDTSISSVTTVNEEQENENEGDNDARNENRNEEQENEWRAEAERLRQEMQELRQQNEYWQNQAQFHMNQGQEDENLRILKMRKLAAETEKSKFENITKRIGPFNSKLNSEIWAQRLEVECQAEELSWEYFLRSMRHFFTSTSDEDVKTWFERKETVLVPKINQAHTEQQRKRVWEEFRDDFTEQYDPTIRAQLAEDKYEHFELTEDMSAEAFVNKLQDIILETDPHMVPKLQVRKMLRKLPEELREHIDDPHLSSVPKFLKRLQTVLKGERKKKKQEQDKDKASSKKTTEKEDSDKISLKNHPGSQHSTTESSSDALSLRVFQGQCYFCNKTGHKASECRSKLKEENKSGQLQPYYQRGGTRGQPHSFGRGFGRGNISFRGTSRGRGNYQYRGQGRGGFQYRGGFQDRGGFFGRGGYRGYSDGPGRNESTVRNIVQEVLQTQSLQPGVHFQQQQAIPAPGFIPQALPQVPFQNQSQGQQGVYKPENY